MSITVLVADDEAIVRHGVRGILEHADGIEVVGEAPDGRAAVTMTRSLRPDVVLMDLRMPNLDGIAATREVVAQGAKVLVLTTYDLDENLYRSFRAGAGGFVLKTAEPSDLVHAVRVVARGDALLEPRIVRRLIEQYVEDPVRRQQPPWASRLSDREREVLRLLARGQSNAEIAAKLFLSEGTVKTHIAGVFSKIGVRDRLQAVVTAYESGYVVPGESAE